jgi:hypothetical protein
VVLLPAEQWPDPDDEGVTHLSAGVATKLFATLRSIGNFVEAYRARCTETGD